MSEALYERYKDALRRGHLAALSGRLEDAIAAYSEAASIASERPLPFTSLGGVQLRLGRTAEALAAYGAALERSPRDEAALLGRAEALKRAGRRAEAAATFDLASEVQDADGRRVEALDTTCRALELAESKARRRRVEDLAQAVGETGSGGGAEDTLERAARVLEAGRRAIAATEALQPALITEGGAEGERPAPDPIALMEAVDAALDAGRVDVAQDDLLALARSHGAAGRFDTALDWCYRALAIAPDDVELHLELVELYLANGWRGLASEKVGLLIRLVELDGDEAAQARVRKVAAERFPEETRFAAR